MFAKLVLLFSVVICIAGKKGKENSPCNIVATQLSREVQFLCQDLSALHPRINEGLDNTTSISIRNSRIRIIPRYSFSIYASSLQLLDLQQCGIEILERDAFASLFYLRKLDLSQNKLTRVMGESFGSLISLQHLDISFNNIVYIDDALFKTQILPILQEFYFDYNQLETIDYSLFSLLPYLRRVKMGRNPWKWGYRLLLIQQLENSRVDYRDDIEEWGWLTAAAKECEDSGVAKIPSDLILDCVISKLLRTDSEGEDVSPRLLPAEVISNPTCVHEASTAIDCYLRTTSPREAMRRTLEGTVATMKQMHIK